MNNSFNLKRAIQLHKRVQFIDSHPFATMDQIKSIEVDPGLEPHKEPGPPRWLYWFVNQYTFIENENLKSKVEIKTDAEVIKLLQKYKTADEMPVTAAYLPQVDQVLPEALKSRNDVKLITVADGPALSNQIYSSTLVRIDPEKLSNKELIAFMKLSLSAKEKIFMSMVNQDKMKTETRDRILKCLQIADEKQKKECLKNCKK